MLYLSRFVFPDWDDDYQFRLDLKRTCYNSIYPFFVLSERGLTELNFAPVTVLYGGNGSGKTTALNVIAEALSLSRNAPYNRSDFFGDYVGLCSFSLSAVRQIELRDFLENAARFFGCQFVIATHSPFLLSMRGAKVYDLDAAPAAVKRWTQLPDIRAAHEFFEAHRDEFRSPDKK